MSNENVTSTPKGKSEFVRAEFANEDYLAFNELHSRIVFKDPDLTSTKSRVESVKFAVKFTTQAVKSIIGGNDGGLFIEDDEKALMNRIAKHFKAPLEAKLNDVSSLLRDLSKINTTVGEDDENITLTSKQWTEIMLKVIVLKAE